MKRLSSVSRNGGVYIEEYANRKIAAVKGEDNPGLNGMKTPIGEVEENHLALFSMDG